MSQGDVSTDDNRLNWGFSEVVHMLPVLGS